MNYVNYTTLIFSSFKNELVYLPTTTMTKLIAITCLLQLPIIWLNWLIYNDFRTVNDQIMQLMNLDDLETFTLIVLISSFCSILVAVVFMKRRNNYLFGLYIPLLFLTMLFGILTIGYLKDIRNLVEESGGECNIDFLSSDSSKTDTSDKMYINVICAENIYYTFYYLIYLFHLIPIVYLVIQLIPDKLSEN
jgi:hypothetical protein